MPGAIDLFAGSNSIGGSNLFTVNKNPLNQIDQGIEDVLGQHGQNVGQSIWDAIQTLIDSILGINPNGPLHGLMTDITNMLENLWTFLGELNPLDPNFDPIAAIITFIEDMLKPSNLLAVLVKDATQSGGVTGLIPLENLALDLIEGAIGGVQNLIDAIMAAFGFGPGTASYTEVNKLFSDLYAFLGNPSGWATDLFDAAESIVNFITTMLHPTNLLAPLEQLLAGVFTIPPINIGGLDASKIVSGQFAYNMILGLETAVSALPSWLIPFIPVSAIGAGSPNLIPNPNYAGATSVNDPSGRFTWDAAVDHTGDGSGSAMVHGTGVSTSLVSQATIPVAAGQQAALSHWLQWAGISASPAEAFILSLLTYSGTKLLTQNDVASISGPGASAGWTQLSGSYTIPAGVDGVRVLLTVTSGVNGGTIHWDDASLTETNTLDQGLVTGLVGDLSNLLSQISARALITDFDNLLNTLGLGNPTLTAITTRLANLTGAGGFDAAQLFNLPNIPQLLATSVAGIGGLPNIGASLQKTWDSIAAAGTGLGSIPAIIARLGAIGSTGLLDASQLSNIVNIPQLLSTSIAGIGGLPNIGASLQQTWDNVAGAALGGGTLAKINTRLTGLAGNGAFNAALLSNIANIPQLLAASVAGIGGLPNIGASLQQTWDAVANMTAGTGTLAAVITRLAGLAANGLFDASQLTNITNIPQLLAASVAGIGGATNIGASVQSLIDQAFQASFGGTSTGNPLTSFLTALTQFPHQNVVGVLGPGQIGQSLNSTVDSIYQGWTASGLTGVSLGQLSNAATQIANNILHALNIGTTNSGFIANRATSKPSFMSIDPTADSVFNLANITGTTATTVPVTSSTSVIGMIGTPDAGIKQSVAWLGYGTTNITAMNLNLYQVNTSTGALTFMYQSPNIVSTVGSGAAPSWNYYQLPASAYLSTVQGNWYAVEMVVTGTGTYNIVGVTNSWMPPHPTAFPSKLGASRATGLATPTFLAAGTAQNGYLGTTSASVTIPITIPAAATCLVVEVESSNAAAGIPALTVSMAGGAITLNPVPGASVSVGGEGIVAIYGLMNPPTGPQSVVVTATGAAFTGVTANAVAYSGVAGFGTPGTAAGTTTPMSHTITTGAAGTRIAQIFGVCQAAGNTISAYNQTQQWIYNGGQNQALGGDAPGAASVLFSATIASTSQWGSVAVPLLPGPTPPGNIPSPTYSTNVPWFALSGAAGATQYPAGTTPFATSGSYTVPAWMKAGNKFDIAVLGGAGAGGCDLFGVIGNGGGAGMWATRATLVYGTDIPTSTTSFTVTIGTGGTGTPTSGNPGNPSSITIAGYGTITAAAGAGGTGGGGGSVTGASPGNQTINGTPYYGGATQTVASQPGNAPGGGGAGGTLFSGGGGAAGAPGEAWITAYQ
jgi:hypothetical protein